MKRVEVVAGVIWRHGRFIGSQRVRGGHAGYWEFPGGKVNAGESCLQALTRELREELGIELEEATLWRTVEHEYSDRCIRLQVFEVKSFAGEPRSVEGQPVKWLTIDEARELPFLEADVPLVQSLREPDEWTAMPDLAAAFEWVASPLRGVSPAL